MRRTRRRLSLENPDAAETLAKIGAHGLLAALPDAGIVAGYHPLGAEIDPEPLLWRLTRAGWRVALPRAADPLAPLVFGDAGAPRTPDAFGIPAPSADTPLLTPSLILVPLLAFDRFGGRLGQGAGCYDRTLAGLRRSGPVLAAGLAFAGQEVERVPTDEHDAPLDLILTERGLVDVVRA